MEVGVRSEVLDVRERARREVVERADLPAVVEQQLAEVGADEAGTSGDQGLAHGRGGYRASRSYP